MDRTPEGTRLPDERMIGFCGSLETPIRGTRETAGSASAPGGVTVPADVIAAAESLGFHLDDRGHFVKPASEGVAECRLALVPRGGGRPLVMTGATNEYLDFDPPPPDHMVRGALQREADLLNDPEAALHQFRMARAAIDGKATT